MHTVGFGDCQAQLLDSEEFTTAKAPKTVYKINPPDYFPLTRSNTEISLQKKITLKHLPVEKQIKSRTFTLSGTS